MAGSRAPSPLTHFPPPPGSSRTRQATSLCPSPTPPCLQTAFCPLSGAREAPHFLSPIHSPIHYIPLCPQSVTPTETRGRSSGIRGEKRTPMKPLLRCSSRRYGLADRTLFFVTPLSSRWRRNFSSAIQALRRRLRIVRGFPTCRFSFIMRGRWLFFKRHPLLLEKDFGA